MSLSQQDTQFDALPLQDDRGGGGRPKSRREQTRLYYRLSAILFLGGGVAGIPPNLLYVPRQSAAILLLPAVAIISGIVTWVISDRAPRAGLHVVAVVATVEVSLAVAFASTTFAVYYVFIAVFAAYVFTDRRAIGAQIGFTIAATLAPIAYDPSSARELTIQALVLIPTLIIAGGMVTYLREQLAASEARYRELSERDPLTGVGNYRMLVNRLPLELRRHARYDRPLTLIVMDLDDFKRVNDLLGHQRGDRLLGEVADTLIDAVRTHDIVVRQGGDEFAVIAPETSVDDALQLAERLRSRVATIAADGYPIGATIGCAHYPEDAESLQSLLSVADERLRVAKGDGIPKYRLRGRARRDSLVTGLEPVTDRSE
jgi:diguanylate cyclase (GGDEF)-like protein